VSVDQSEPETAQEFVAFYETMNEQAVDRRERDGMYWVAGR
jgi:hypothetical protein